MKKGIVAGVAAGIGVGAGYLAGKLFYNAPVENADKAERLQAYYDVLYPWLILKQENKLIETYFTEHGIEEIAIYGIGNLGNCLYDELKNSKIEVKYAIDRNAESTYQDIDVLNPDDDVLPAVDAVVVTPVHVFSDIKRMLSSVVDCQIISLEEVINEM